MSLRKTILKSTNFFLALFILFTVLPVKLNYSSGVIIILIILSVINLLFFEKLTYKKKSYNIFISSLPLIVYAIGLFNSLNLDYGLNFLVKNLSFLAFPFIFWSLSNHINNEKLFKVYLLGLIVVNLYLFYLFFYYFNFGTNFYMIITTDIYHSTYLGMYNLLAYWICILVFYKKDKTLFGFLAVFFLISAIITSARIIFVLSIISICVTIFILIKSKIKRLIILSIVSSIGVLFAITVPSINQKFNQLTEIEKFGFDKNNYQSISSRFGKIEASLKVINDNLWFGTGTGDLIDELVKEYENMDFVMGYKYRYNPHNQYLDNIARNGLIGGCLCLTTIFLWPFIVALRKKNPTLLAFTLVISGVCLTESILNVHKGITFYTFFATFLINNTIYKKDRLLLNNNE
ncbi:O-antigen ligase family protein [Hanstruepera flava]|uniref:O-antigen ligase family protein n=1 Tax=Hanstruepera flava TaxID=2930218 RepID=UPI002028DD2F|nr:O-antigen ligase family protein [Hanstruepera flava]